MEHHTAKPSGLATAVTKAYTRKWTFLAAFALTLFFGYSFLASVGLNPELKLADGTRERPRLSASARDALAVEQPVTVSIPALEREVRVENPTSTNIATLDAALLKGAVRYPTSAKLGEEGNVILFGHSSYLPVVHNDAYKAFNGVQDLVKGDEIIVEGNGHTYIYAVENVYEAKATTAAIPLTTEGYTLTLVTCDSFASKEDRFVVVAKLVESYPLAN